MISEIYSQDALSGGSPPRVSVVMACYNGEKYLLETLECIEGQTYKDYELLIINDGSTDGSVNIALKFLGANPSVRARIIGRPNGGISNARNTGVGLARGVYILVIDQDDIISSEYLEEAVKLIEKSPDAGIVTAYAAAFGARNDMRRNKNRKRTETFLRKGNYIAASSLYRKDAWASVGGYKPDVDGYEDYEFWVSMVEAGYKVRQIEKVLYFWRAHNANASIRATNMRYSLLGKFFVMHPRFFAPKVSWLFGEKTAIEFLKAAIYFVRLKEGSINFVYPFYKPVKAFLKRLTG